MYAGREDNTNWNVAKQCIRCKILDDTKGKTDGYEYFKYCNDKVLVGPSLIEGLSLMMICRFRL